MGHGREAGGDSERHLSWAGREVKAQKPTGWEARADRTPVGELAGRKGRCGHSAWAFYVCHLELGDVLLSLFCG